MKKLLILILLFLSIFLQAKNIVIISPHIDDSVLSLGGIIDKYNKDYNITVIDVFSISAWAKTKQYYYELKSIVDLRKNEEKQISKVLNYHYIFLDYNSRYPFQNKNGSADIYSDIMTRLNKGDIILCPLGLMHPNHIYIHNICERIKKSGYNVCWYEDLPYMIWENKNIVTDLRKKYREQDIEINLNNKLNAIKLYTSQVYDIWFNSIRKYSQSIIKGKVMERIWY